MNKLRFGFILVLSTLLLISGKFHPVMGMSGQNSGQVLLDGAMHTYHSDQQIGESLPEGTCLSCHPGLRSEQMGGMLAAMGIGCLDCHSGITAMDGPGNLPGLGLLSCSSCHDQYLISSPAAFSGASNPGVSCSDSKFLMQPEADDSAIPFCTVPGTRADEVNPYLNHAVQLLQSLAYVSSIIQCSDCHNGTNQVSFGHFGTE